MKTEMFFKKSLMEFNGCEIVELKEGRTCKDDVFVKIVTKGGIALFCYDKDLFEPLRKLVAAKKKLDVVCTISGKTHPLVDVATWCKNEGNGNVPTVSDMFFKIAEVWEAREVETPRLILNDTEVWSAFSKEQKAGNGSNYISFSARDPETKQVFEIRCFDDSDLFKTIRGANLKKGDKVSLCCEVSRVRKNIISDATILKKYGISEDENKGVKYYFRPVTFKKEEKND